MRVAIAGGSSPTLGSSIVSALLATEGRYTPVILSRKSKTPREEESNKQNGEVETRCVDYQSHASLVLALSDVAAVISVLLIPGPDWVTAQVNLLHAAEAAGCQRFAPSEFALTSWAHTMVDLLDIKNTVWNTVRASVDQGKIDAARFPCGMFMNYLGIGCPESKRTDALAGFQEGPFLVHLDGNPPWVEVPVQSDNTMPNITMTDIRDVGKFIVAALDMKEPWGGRELGMAGDTLSFEKLINICQRYIGRPIEVRPVKEDELQARLSALLPDQVIPRMECQLAIVCSRGASVVPSTLKLSASHPTTVDEYMRLYW
ncbi:hypothetical protein N7499_010227 [Penicillium canescens]|uniref:NmrA-like domain-containing protein n=1 Tax=Penicillium canescens TaxID=5083 RepID=A0AAD6NDQ3_PENCN|nr:uncharacterized protein N7446_007632 [Penicillium canescens]KAJ6018581.1 hypothetical protein N7522_000648 [Penicillium canescens]KAJ6034071.1 hypothetical protein N7444_011842 [Penicillium canescens]KAJ6056741.1 hypothetical protein N7460_000015 [Penicillium canescens]KAJ6058049.1 hypothetical protein N7446_007632 [Penicillium canescens]KAJ6072213.1 hypothetical protein N7499_010227 [Penicillium canescens]